MIERMIVLNKRIISDYQEIARQQHLSLNELLNLYREIKKLRISNSLLEEILKM